ncbi:Ig-like domain-containing protein [Massilia sp. MB5]|uniref:SpvB/TcaC N-terminal domain-containing protein n=1 Tax=Massilia sp. MB5 TaxID=2919578 RepID=UPI001F0F5BFE|nr:SpvB/TcaC N-terminal domain-containing protein [Massilia sp. MB5]UMR33383.1 Ig-like domain-containing protein [Massilia sp. MB5]
MRAVISAGDGSYDEVAFNFNGEWIAASPDSAAGAYYANKANVPAGTYTIYAKVRDGNTTLYTNKRQIVVGAAGVTLTLNSPSSGDSGNVNAPLSLRATATGATASINSVKFYANGSLIANASASGDTWNASWIPQAAATYAINAQAFDGAGQKLAESSGVNVVIGNSTPTSGTPIPVEITPPHLGNAEGGTLPGALEVSNTGNATYTLPLDVPPGSANLTPQLSLNYTSDGANGVLGLGWSLGGISSIQRCGRTIAQDGVNGRISFDKSDRLCLDGKRLVLVNLPLNDDNYWSDSAEYRTESEAFSRIRTQNTGGRRSFVIESRDGRILSYGSASGYVEPVIQPVRSSDKTDTMPAAKAGARAWSLDKINDRIGNFITFGYTQNPVSGEHRLLTVRYGGNGKSPHAAIQFSYDEGRSDKWRRYVDETRNDLVGRISEITTYTGADLSGAIESAGTVVRRLRLQYDNSPSSGRSLLSSVEACARNPQSAAMECLPPTRFNWGKPDPAKQPGFVSRGMWPGAPILTTHGNGNTSRNHSDYFAFADFENHGYTDILEKRVASAIPADINSAAGSWREQSNPIPPGTLRSQYRYFHNTGSGFAQYSYRISTGEDFAVLDIGDFDGNGAPDILVSTAAGARICLSPWVTRMRWAHRAAP